MGQQNNKKFNAPEQNNNNIILKGSSKIDFGKIHLSLKHYPENGENVTISMVIIEKIKESEGNFVLITTLQTHLNMCGLIFKIKPFMKEHIYNF